MKRKSKTYEKRMAERDSSPASVDPYLNLCGAILIQALRDTRSDDPEERFDAVAWLAGEDASTFAHVLGLGDIFIELTRGRACLPGRILKPNRR